MGCSPPPLAKAFLIIKYPQDKPARRKVWGEIHPALKAGINVVVEVEGEDAAKASLGIAKTVTGWYKKEGIPMHVCRKGNFGGIRRSVWMIPL